MKKFGTPIGAAPGWATEYVGFAMVGWPLAVRSGRADFARFLPLLPAFPPALSAPVTAPLRPGCPAPSLWCRVFCACWLPPCAPDDGWPDEPEPGVCVAEGVGVAVG